MVCSSDAVAIIRIVILDEIPVDGFRHRSRHFSLTGKLCFENLPCEVSLSQACAHCKSSCLETKRALSDGLGKDFVLSDRPQHTSERARCNSAHDGTCQCGKDG